jgi:hypothetical protein
MTLKKYLITMGVATLVCWAGWVYVIFLVDPFATNWVGFLLFYLSFFLALTGSAALLGFFIRFVILKHELAFRAVKEAFRQSFLFSFLIIASLFLLSRNLFTWVNLGLLIVGLTVLEFFLLSYTKG